MEVVGEEDDDDDEDGSSGAGEAGSGGGWADGGGGDCGWVGETRGRSGGTEKGSERAAFGGKVVREGEGGFLGTVL
jgi:hypothetical protein